ncbi:hypothetical protein VSDG_05374 [Cytospora chrysosperma]|uniref:C-CAP/cofactor C-like domain-containing protein n=1 Tax=Cytospora chrysosperma TaxID=252740 RepID=A0A423VWV4_CYTCH|nr:hypothetical protein VSDG_05374 [Valsa sordida]
METVSYGPMTYNGDFPGLKTNMDPKERFYRHFESQATSLQEEIANLGDISASGGERQDAIDRVLAGISRLTNEVSDASEYAPPRDQMIYGQALKALREQLNIQTRSLGPKSRFEFTPESKEAFVSATNRSAAAASADADADADADAASDAVDVDVDDDDDDDDDDVDDNTDAAVQAGATHDAPGDYNAEMAREPGTAIRKPSFSRSRGEVDISGHRGMHIILPPTARRAGSSASVTNLRGCVLDMSSSTGTGTGTGTGRQNSGDAHGGAHGDGESAAAPPAPFASLAIRNVSRSLVIAGRVDGPAHVTGVRGSVLVLDARQVRMHECAGVTVYLWCGSHPIIEGCSGVRFAPLPGVYSSQLPLAGGHEGENQWDQVDDFNWLKAEASPNWERLSPSGGDGGGGGGSVIPADFWTETVRGGPLLSTEDILRKAGI